MQKRSLRHKYKNLGKCSDNSELSWTIDVMFQQLYSLKEAPSFFNTIDDTH